MPSDDTGDQQTLAEALTHATNGRRDIALTSLLKLAGQSEAAEFRLWQRLSVTALNHPGGTSALTVFAPYRHTDIADAPPEVSATLRFLHAVASRDPDGLRRYYRAVKAAGKLLAGDVTGLLLDAAAEALQARQGDGDRPV